jgi:hypothetical protein
MAADATKIYEGPILAIGIAAAATADGGSFTDLGYMDEEGAMTVLWEALTTNISDGNLMQLHGRGSAEITIIQTDPAGAQATLETYLTAKCKLKITTVDGTNGYYFIDEVFISYSIERGFKPGDYHKLIVKVSRVTENADDFCNGPKAAS